MRTARFAETRDGAMLAWTRSGTGPPLVKTATWLTHLEYDEESLVWGHWIDFLEKHFDYIRYDERGCGLSGSGAPRNTIDQWTDDLETVIEAAGIDQPCILLGKSQGAATAISYAVRHPERVSHLILYGGYARGVFRRNTPEAEALYRGIVDVFRHGLHDPNPVFQDVFTARFVPDATPAQRDWFNTLCQKTTSAERAEEILLARGEVEITDLLPLVRAKTLVLHQEDDQVCPIHEGRLIAARIPGAEFAALPGRNHIIQQDEPAWAAFCGHVERFLGLGETRIEGLTDREAAILRLICAARSNKIIAHELGISEKTVRNHATRIFEKLGVQSRQEAIVAAAARGFAAS